MTPIAPPSPVTLDTLRSSAVSMPVVMGKRVTDAYALAQRAYEQHMHWTGVPYIEQALRALKLLLKFSPDEDAVIACLLKYIPDTKKVSLIEVGDRFGKNVRQIVADAKLLSEISLRPRRMSSDALRLMMIRVSDDHRALLVFLCGRTVALESLPLMPLPERRRIAQDALRLLSPLAASVGVYALKHIIEAMAFPVAYPNDAERITSQQMQVHGHHGAFLAPAAEQLTETLKKHGIACRVEAREKQPYSIFNKMNSKGVSQLTSVYDLFALRVIVESDDDCYVALGLLHRIAHPVPNRFKDYIAFPKPNGYQSLHTTLASFPGVPSGVFVEVQIRTARMHEEAEFGIAAHWNYKQGGTPEHALRRFQLLKSADQRESSGDVASGFIDHMYVLTPKGDIIELPEGATPLDFAFQVHTDIGLAFRAARVNGAVVPLTHTLENGDVVEIIKSAKPQPSPRWIKLLKTASARSRLKRYLADRQEQAGVVPEEPKLAPKRPAKGAVAKRAKSGPLFRAVNTGVDVPLPLKAAQCCKPKQGEGHGLMGITARSGIIRVHRENCKLIKNVDPKRTVAVEWNS